MEYNCFDHLNPALRDFYASERKPTDARLKRPHVAQHERIPPNYSFGEEKLKDLFHDPLPEQDFEDDYYPQECNYLSRQGDLFAPSPDPIDEELVRQQLLLLSTRADEELLRYENHGYERAPGKKVRAIIEEHLDQALAGFGEKRPEHWEPPQEDQNRKRRLCRHFLKGHCKRGKACDFLHDSSIFCPDLQKVFLGGLPAHITESSLRTKLLEQGYQVINKPKVLRGFTPQVCLGSVEEAQRLIEKGKINIDGSLVDVRPYEAFAKDNLEKKLPDDIKRSVFLGGLATGTTGARIKDDLEKMDVKVVNHPIIKTGFAPMVTVGSIEMAQMLVKLKKVLINDTLVDVRPYVDFRKRY